MDGAAISCTLNAGSLNERLAWIAALNARSLKSARREGLTLTLDYVPEAIDDVRKLVAGEQACCAFLTFDIVEHRDFVRVSIAAPEEARDAVDALFEPFASRGQANEIKTCGCVTECRA